MCVPSLSATMRSLVRAAAVFAAFAARVAPTLTVRRLAPATAPEAASDTLADGHRCADPVAAAVLDRASAPQALVHACLTGAHAPNRATGKGCAALRVRPSALRLAPATQPGELNSGMRNLPRVVANSGGVPIVAGGRILGAIGVSGAPGDDTRRPRFLTRSEQMVRPAGANRRMRRLAHVRPPQNSLAG